MDDTRDDEKRALMLKLYDVEAPMTRLEALEDVASRPTTPEELSLLRAVAEAARGIRLGYVRMGTGDELAVIHGGDRMESALRALDAYHPPVEPLPRECCYCHDPITHGEVCSGCRTPLSPAAQAERRPRPPGELVEALQDRVHEIIEKNCPECQGYGQVNLIEIGRPHWVQCAVCRGTGRVPVSRPLPPGTDVCPMCQGHKFKFFTRVSARKASLTQCSRCLGTGRVPVSRPARARKVRDGE